MLAGCENRKGGAHVEVRGVMCDGGRGGIMPRPQAPPTAQHHTFDDASLKSSARNFLLGRAEEEGDCTK